tara:strand:+ start:1916 stop:2554 length:639 start_codon:yes stop_codon:yes gene_type:complete
MISLIVTAYNYDKYIERAIRSGLEQRIGKNQLEVIVINDASTDKTQEILENYTGLIRVFNLSKNIGLAGARNFGIKKARGQFVVFLDADDYLHLDLLFVQQLFLEQNSNIDAVSTNYHLVDDKGNHINQVSAEEEPIACGIMFRKDYLFDIGLYDESFRAREEEDLRHRFLKKFQIFNIPLPLYRYRMHESNLTKNKVEMDHFDKKLKEKHS